MTKLNQGADAALVAAATKAGLASAPQDYSRSFESVAEGYRRTMEASTNLWSKIGTMAGIKYKEIKTAQKEKMEGPGGLENLANGQQLISQVKGFGKELWGTRKLEGGYFGDQAKEARVEINKRKDKIYAFAQNNVAGEQALFSMFNETRDKKGNIIPPSVNAEATGVYPMEVASAYAQSQVGGTTDLGNYFIPEEGKDGKMAWTMYNDPDKIKYESKSIKENPFVTTPDNVVRPENEAKPTKPNGTPVLTPDGKKIRYTMSQINGMMVQKDPNMKGLLNGVFDIAMKSGANSGGNPEIGQYQQNEMDEGLSEISRNRAAWYQKTKYGEGGKSFHGELTQGVGVASSSLFGQLSNVVANGDKTLENTGVLAGIDGMSDGTPGIQAADFQNEDNYKALTMTLFNPGNKNYDPEVTAGIFKEHMQAKIRDVQAHGWSRSPKNPVNKPGYVPPGQGGKLPVIPSIKSSEMFEGGGGDYVSKAILEGNYSAGQKMVQRASFGRGDNMYTWDKKKKSYFHSTDGVVVNKATMFAFLNRDKLEDGMGMSNTFKSLEFFRQIPEWDGSQYLPKEEVEKQESKAWYNPF